MNAIELTKALKGRWHGRDGMARCPAHHDTTPSLAISMGTDGKTLVKCHAGCQQAQVIEALRALGLWDGAASNLRGFPPKTNHANGDHAIRIWEQCVLATGTLVETYLASRGIIIPIADVLRFHPTLKHPDGGVWPAMVARVDRGGEHVAIHRTFLKPDGSGMAPVPRPRLMLGPCAGGAVRLSEPAEKLAVGEGIETCLSVLQATGMAVWSALSAPGVMALELPESVREVMIPADADPPGEEAALVAGRKWQDVGLTVKIARPTAGHKDFNDMLKASADITKSINEASPLPVDVAAIAKIENLIDRDQKINEEAARVGCSRQAVRQELKRLEKNGATDAPDKSRAHWGVEPWASQVDGRELFDAISKRIKRHVELSIERLLIATIWAIFTWFHDECVHSPQLVITSPAPECGKSTLLGLLKYLVRRGFLVADTTSAPVYRAIEAWHPALLLDEADHAFRKDQELGSIFNSGWTRGTGVLRCHPDSLEPEVFDTFTPKAIGLVGLKMPPATLSRSIIIRMERKLPDQKPDDFLYVDDGDLAALRSKLARFAADNAERFRKANPEGLEGFSNRLWANWRPLLVVAELCGAVEEVRKAAAATATRGDSLTMGVVLITDIIAIMEERGATKLHSEVILDALHTMEDRPWNEWGTKMRKPMSKHQLASMLRPFEIHPTQKKVAGQNLNGYELADLKRACARYGAASAACEATAEAAEDDMHPRGVVQSSTSLHPLADKGLRGIQSSTATTEVELQKTRNPLKINGGREVEVQTPPCAGFNGHGALCAHCGDPAEEGNPIIATVVGADGEKLPLHDGCRADWFNQTRGE